MEKSKLIRNVGMVGGLTGLSRVMGMARDMLMARFFGTSLFMSAFVVAFTVPNLFRRLLGEGALSAAFIPIFVETRRREGDAQAWLLARRIISLVSAMLAAITLLGLAVVSLWLRRDGLDPQTGATLSLLRIMMPYLFFISLMALSMGLLNSFYHFAIPAFTPFILNAVWIGCLAVVCPLLPDSLEVRIRAVAWAVLLAGVLQLAIQIPALRARGYRFGWSLSLADPKVNRVLQLLGPAALGIAVTQVNIMLDKVLAAWIGDWAPAALWYSERLVYLPMGLFATALGTVLLPVFSTQAAERNHAATLATMNHSLRSLLFVMTPAALGLLVLAKPIVRLIFQWGEFDEASVGYTAFALQCYAPGLMVFSLAKVIVPAFYSLQDTRTPVKVGLCTVGVKLALSLAFIATWPLALRHGGLALATVLAEGAAAIALGLLLRRRMGALGWGQIARSFLRTLAAAAAAAAAAFALCHFLLGRLAATTLPAKGAEAAAVLGAIAAAIALHALFSALLRSPEMTDIVRALRRRSQIRPG